MVDSDSEEEGEPMQARRKERKAMQAAAVAPSSLAAMPRAAATASREEPGRAVYGSTMASTAAKLVVQAPPMAR